MCHHFPSFFNFWKLTKQNNTPAFSLCFWATAAPIRLGFMGKHLHCPGKGSSGCGSVLKPGVPFQVNGNRIRTTDISEKDKSYLHHTSTINCNYLEVPPPPQWSDRKYRQIAESDMNLTVRSKEQPNSHQFQKDSHPFLAPMVRISSPCTLASPGSKTYCSKSTTAQKRGRGTSPIHPILQERQSN